MMPGVINNPLPLSQAAGIAGFVSKLADEAELPFSALQIPVATARLCGPSRTASRQIIGPNVRPNHQTRPQPMNVEALCKPRMPVNLELSAEREAPNYGSSGSNHEPSSVSLFAMVHEFIENNGAAAEKPVGEFNGSDGSTINKESSKLKGVAEAPQTIQNLALCKDDTEEMLLRDTKLILNSIVTEVGHVCDDGKVPTMAHSCLKRTVMSRLQKMGYAAAICKSKWDHFCSTPAGDYEYIDVLLPSGIPSKLPERLVVDINFQAEFEIARPTDEFTATWQLLPPIFVGREERLKQIIQIVTEATKQSMHIKGLHLPPWRKSAYVKAKWFSSYKRTANPSAGRPCREMEPSGNNLGLTVSGGVSDLKCTNALEILYHDIGAKPLTGDGRDVNMPLRERDEITVLMTEWQPPAMVPRCMGRSKQGRLMGLTSLLNAQAPSCNNVLVQAA